MCSAADCTLLDSLLCRGKWLGYCTDDVPTVADLFNTADDFFHRVKTISNQVLLPDQTDIPYQLRIRSQNMSTINKTKFLNDADLIIRMIYKYSYKQMGPIDCITLIAVSSVNFILYGCV